MFETLTIEVTGMKCGGCEANITQKLQALAGVNQVQADHKTKQVTVSFDPTQIDQDAIEEVIIEAGFGVN